MKIHASLKSAFKGHLGEVDSGQLSVRYPEYGCEYKTFEIGNS